jgi:hypothetical protein
MPVQTKDVIVELLKSSEDGMDDFKRWLNAELHRQIVTVVFTKKDGTERTMRCTLNEHGMPPSEAEKAAASITESKTPRKANPDVRTCYDVDGGAWKSFRWDSVKSVTYNVSELI